MTHFSTENTTQDVALREVLQTGLPVESASPELRQRVAQMAQSAVSRREMKAKKRATRLKLTFSGAVLASLVAVFALVWPQVMSNQALAQMDAAMARVSSVHMTRFRIDGAKKIKEGESWYQNGQWRVESPEDGFTTIYKNGQRWNFNPRAGTVTLQRGVKGAFGRNPSGFTLENMMGDFQAQGDKVSVTTQGQTTLNGRQVNRQLLQIVSKQETLQLTLLVDAETDLPLRGEMTGQSHNSTRPGPRTLFEMSYNRPLSAKLFEPKFTRGARFVELGRRDEDFKTRLARGLVKKRVGERIVAIRALQVNRNGDVFLLYTAGKRLGKTTGDGFRSNNWFAGRDWKVFLTDSLGTRYSYMRNDFEFSLYPMAVQGQRLEGDWWVPATTPRPGQKWKPRTFFLNFEVNPKNLHGTFKQTFQVDYSARARFAIGVDEAESSVVPSLAESLQTGLSEDDIVKTASEARGELPPGIEPSPQLVRELSEIGTFSPDSKQIATGIVGGVRIVSAESGAQIKVLRVPAPFSKLKVGAPLISADNRLICAAEAVGRKLKSGRQWFVWSVGSGQLLGSWRLAVPDDSLRNVQLSPDGKSLYVVSSRDTKRGSDGKIDWVESENIQVQERDVLTGKVRFERVLKHEGFVISVDQSVSNAADWRVVTNQLGNQKRGESGVTRAWNVRSGTVAQIFGKAPGYENVRIVLAKRAPLLATWGNYFEDKNDSRHVMDKEIRLYDATSGKLQRTITPNTDWVSAFALSGDGLRLASDGGDHTISVWNTQTGRLEQSLTGHGTNVYRLEFSPDGKWLQSVDAKEKALLWKLG